jgi:hypothetical protein
VKKGEPRDHCSGASGKAGHPNRACISRQHHLAHQQHVSGGANDQETRQPASNHKEHGLRTHDQLLQPHRPHQEQIWLDQINPMCRQQESTAPGRHAPTLGHQTSCHAPPWRRGSCWPRSVTRPELARGIMESKG